MTSHMIPASTRRHPPIPPRPPAGSSHTTSASHHSNFNTLKTAPTSANCISTTSKTSLNPPSRYAPSSYRDPSSITASPPLLSHSHTSGFSPAKFDPADQLNRECERESDSQKAQSLPLSPTAALHTSSASDLLALSLLSGLNHTTEEEAAKISKIWGEGRLSGDTSEAHLEGEKAIWSESVWRENTGPSFSWDQLPAADDSGAVWSGLDPMGGGVRSKTVDSTGLVGRPLPCEFGPIGKRSTEPKAAEESDRSPKTQLSDSDGGLECSTGHSSQANIQTPLASTIVSCSGSSSGGHSREGVVSPAGVGEGGRERTPSAELWVSAEAEEDWPYYDDDVIPEAEGDKKEGGVNSSCDHTHTDKARSADDAPGSSPCNYKQLASANEVEGHSSSFDDPAIVNVVKSSESERGGTHTFEPTWRRARVDVDESVYEVSLFATPTDESTAKLLSLTHKASPPSPCLPVLTPHPAPTVSPLTTSTAPANYHHSKLTTSSANTILNETDAPDIIDTNELVTPTDMFFNIGSDTSTNNEITVAQVNSTTSDVALSTTSTAAYKEKEEEEVKAGEERLDVKDNYFPSAFEVERNPASYVGVDGRASGESPENDVILTSLVDVGLAGGQIGPNCVSQTTVGERARRNLWPSPGLKLTENVPLLLGTSPLRSETVVTTIDLPRDGEDISVAKGTQHSPQSDLSFLVECFPDLSRPFLNLLLQQSSGNVEEAVSTALLSTVVSPTDPGGAGGRSFNWAPPTPGQLGRGDTDLYGCGLFNGSSALSVTSESEIEGGAEEIDDEDECMDDEEIARIIQEQLNLDAGSSGLTAVDGREREEEGEEDDNLVLRLSCSLATQLQQMFGSVDKHLPVEGVYYDVC